MGRTSRKRRKRKSSGTSNQYLNRDPVVIHLCKWLLRNNWSNDNKLFLKEFPEIGRGLTTKHKSYKKGDVLINIPFNLMISFNTLANDSNFVELFDGDNTFTIHDLLSVYLALEKHKRGHSLWHPYIASLPAIMPELPWLLIPSISLPHDIKAEADGQRSRFLTAWSKITTQQSICNCGCQNRWDRVLTIDLFRWCYVMVNTRAVYINPLVVLRHHPSTVLRRSLSDDPNMALCPYLDMFNHCSAAGTEASLDAEDLTFRLVTLTPYRKHRQLFISYGAHDNDKLMTEYGFFIDGNQLDCIRFKLEDVVELLKCSKLQFNYVKAVDGSLNAAPMHVSYSLKQVVFVLIRPHVGVDVWNSVTFSEQYTDDDLRDIYDVVQRLLTVRLDLLNDEMDNLVGVQENSVLRAFMRYKVKFCQLSLDSFGEQ